MKPEKYFYIAKDGLNTVVTEKDAKMNICMY